MHLHVQDLGKMAYGKGQYLILLSVSDTKSEDSIHHAIYQMAEWEGIKGPSLIISISHMAG